MNEIIYNKTYAEYKQELDMELSKTAESFVRIGYLLKVARDTDILMESGYKNMAEFAHAEYGLSDTYVSRFIKINDKFSDGGYSDHLLPEYQGFGYAKLALMLQLPEAINEELTPKYSKSEIQAIKDEVDKENKVTDIERALEGTEEKPLIEQIIYNIGKEHPDLYLKMSQRIINEVCTQEDIAECMAPQGVATYTTRIRGIGSVILMLDEHECHIVVTRTGEKEDTTWGDIGYQWEKIYGNKENWEELYGEKFPEKEEIAPVQRKESKVIKPAPEEKPKENTAEKPGEEQAKAPEDKENESIPEPATDQNVEQNTLHDVEPTIPEPDPIQEEPQEEEPAVQQSEEQIERQDAVENHSEWMPDQNKDVQQSAEVPKESTAEESGQEQDETSENKGNESIPEETQEEIRAAVSEELEALNDFWNGQYNRKAELMLGTLREMQDNLEKLRKAEEIINVLKEKN